MAGKKDKTRKMILDTSYGLFASKGFSEVTMKDVCEITGMSRGGLYSHFSSTKELFEEILETITQKDEMNFYREMDESMSAIEILDRALVLMEEEMNHPEDSLSFAMYEYSAVSRDKMMNFNVIGEQKWSDLVKYGIERGEFNDIDVYEIVNLINYAYQGIRMWSCIVDINPKVFTAIINNIRKQLVKEV